MKIDDSCSGACMRDGRGSNIMALSFCMRSYQCTGSHASVGIQCVCGTGGHWGRLQLTFGGDGRHIEARSVWLGERLVDLQV